MSSLMESARTRVLLAGTRPPSEETADRWLIRLRWVAIAGMLVTTLVGLRLVPDLRMLPLLASITGIALLNGLWSFLVWRAGPGQSPYLTRQIAVDVLSLSVVLWFAGGVTNPFAVFLTFQIVLAGLLCSAPVALAVTGLTLVMTGVLSFAEPLPLGSSPLGPTRVQNIADLMSLAALSTFLGFFVFVFVQLRQDLRRENERNEKLAMLGRLVGGMSHELNTPLATILLASKDLVLVGNETGNPDVEQLSRTIADEAQRCADIIGLMRGHVRPGQLNETIDVAAFVTEGARRECDRLGFTGELVIHAHGPVPVLALRAGLAHVLKNLLTNAVEALSAAQVAHPKIEVDVSERHGRVEISVRDNGPGIDPNLLDRLGEPFQTTKEAKGGMGLGLYISTVVAERLGGHLSVQSGEGGGTRVTLALHKASH
jgi:two-component system sensor histidine kinase RegB